MKRLISLGLLAITLLFSSCSADSIETPVVQEQVNSLQKSKPEEKPPLFIFGDTNDTPLLYIRLDGTVAPVPASSGWMPCPGGGSFSGGIASVRYWNTNGQFLMVERSFTALEGSPTTSIGSTYGLMGQLFWRTSYVKGC